MALAERARRARRTAPARRHPGRTAPLARRGTRPLPARAARALTRTPWPLERAGACAMVARQQAPHGNPQPEVVMQRKAIATWSGGLKDGRGTLSTDSRVIAEVPYSFARRFENEPGTNPEELIAAAE